MIEHVLKYEKMGMSVIPVRPDKKPFIPWTEFQKRHATPEEITAWFKKWPNAMIGIVTGSISRVCVIDCDNGTAYQEIQALLPESLVTATARTPRGHHLFFAYPQDKTISNAAGIIPGVDVRGEGGYVIAPPSINAEGKSYAWLLNLSIDEVEPGTVPDAIYKKIFNYIYRPQKATGTKDHIDHIFFTKGRRDEDIYRVANALTKHGCELVFTKHVIEILAHNSKPPFPQSELNAKIESALKRAERRERNIAAEVKEWVLTTNGYIETTSCHKELQLTTREEMKAANMALLRMTEPPNPILEKHRSRRGCYRRIETDIEFMDFLNADVQNYIDITLPLGIHTKTKIFPKGLIVVAGVSGMGKTLFALNSMSENFGKFPIFYFNSEMGPEAFKEKLSYFPIQITEWAKNIKAVDNWDFYNIADKIQPDAFNVVDYLEPEGEKAFNIHGVISAIIRRLNKGVALICIQKKPDAKMGTGGIYSIKASTLALALDWGKIEIVKNRFREADQMPSMNKINFDVHKGYQFVSKGTWYN